MWFLLVSSLSDSDSLYPTRGWPGVPDECISMVRAQLKTLMQPGHASSIIGAAGPQWVLSKCTGLYLDHKSALRGGHFSHPLSLLTHLTGLSF